MVAASRRRQHLQKALALFNSQQFDQAIQTLLPLAATQDPKVDRLLGLTYLRIKNHPKAKAHLQQAYKSLPQDPEVLSNLGALLSLDGENEQGLALLETTKKLVKNFAPYRFYYAYALDCSGRQEEALAQFEQVVKEDPRHLQALLNLSATTRFTPEHPWLHTLLEMTHPDQLPASTEEQAKLYFILGKAYQDLNEPDTAFDYYQRGNQLLYPQRSDSYRLVPLHRWYQQSLTPEKTSQLKQNLDAPPTGEVLICGQSRSGKSLVESLLACHPEVTPGGEHKLLAQKAGRFLPFAKGERDYLNESCRDWQANAHSYLNERDWPATPKVTNTLPENIQIMGIWSAWFPQAPVVFITRNLDDLALANYFKYYGAGNRASFDLKASGYFIRYYEALIDLWIERLPNPCLKIRYEDLVTRPAAISKKLYELVGLDWKPEYFEILQAQRSFSEHLAPHQSLDVPSAIRGDYIGWSAPYKKHLDPLHEGYAEASAELDEAAQRQGSLVSFKRQPKKSIKTLQTEFKQALATHSVCLAERIAHQLIQQNPSEVRFYRLHGIAASLAGFHDTALKSLQQALDLKPGDAGLQVNLLRAELRADQPEAASKRLKKLAPSISDSATLARLQLEVFLAQPSRNHNKLQQQLQSCQQLRQAQPDEPELINAQAQLLALMGEGEQAQTLHQQAYARAEARQAADLKTTQAPLKTQILLDQARSLYHHQPTAVDAACTLLAQALQIRPYSLATRAAWDQLQNWLPECQKPEWQQLAKLHQAMQAVWAHYQGDQLEHNFGDFGLPYQGLESLHLAGGRPALSRLATYGLSDFLPEQARALDIGCNHGYLLIGLADQLGEGWGFDISQTCIQVGQVVAEHLGHSHIHLRHQTFEDFQKEQPEPFDLIIACAVHHWIGAQPKAFGELLLGLSNPGGLVLLESQGRRQLDVTEEGFADKARDIASAGFKVLRKGSLCDDGVNYREFWILQRPHTESGVTA